MGQILDFEVCKMWRKFRVVTWIMSRSSFVCSIHATSDKPSTARILTRFLQSSQLKFLTFSSSSRYEYFSCKRRCRSHASIHTLRHLSQSSFTRGLRNTGSAPLLLKQRSRVNSVCMLSVYDLDIT